MAGPVTEGTATPGTETEGGPGEGAGTETGGSDTDGSAGLGPAPGVGTETAGGLTPAEGPPLARPGVTVGRQVEESSLAPTPPPVATAAPFPGTVTVVVTTRKPGGMLAEP